MSNKIDTVLNQLEKNTQTYDVAKHLKRNGLTSTEAFEKYGITRLSAIIYRLRHKYGLNIANSEHTGLDRRGNKVSFVEYKLRRNYGN